MKTYIFLFETHSLKATLSKYGKRLTIENEYLFQTQFQFLLPMRLQEYQEYTKKDRFDSSDGKKIST